MRERASCQVARMSITRRPRQAYSLIEVLVACALLGAGTASLALALSSDHRLRSMAAAHQGAARRARLHLELLAARACGADTGGASVAEWGTEAWRASVTGGSWRLVDSLRVRGSQVPLVIDAFVACTP